MNDLDNIETDSVEGNPEEIPFDGVKKEFQDASVIDVYGGDFQDIHPGMQVDEGEVVGYGENGTLYVVEGGPEPGPDPMNKGNIDGYVEQVAEALDLGIAGYLDCGSHAGHSEAVNGEDLAELGERNLGDVEAEIETRQTYGVVNFR